MTRSIPSAPVFALLLVLTGACASPPPAGAGAAESEPLVQTEEVVHAEPDRHAERKPMTSLLLYVPNRIVDAFDFVRFGVELGPGFGLDVQATESVRAAALMRLGFGLGLQTLRHFPGRAGYDHEWGFGPDRGTFKVLSDWHRPDDDIRVDVHALFAGGHVAFEPVEFVDFLGGLIGFDLADDDL